MGREKKKEKRKKIYFLVCVKISLLILDLIFSFNLSQVIV
jgi:hypothetical protein